MPPTCCTLEAVENYVWSGLRTYFDAAFGFKKEWEADRLNLGHRLSMVPRSSTASFENTLERLRKEAAHENAQRHRQLSCHGRRF
jgi:hypothetical protein